MIFLWSQKGLGGHSAPGVKTDIWVRAVGYQQLGGCSYSWWRADKSHRWKEVFLWSQKGLGGHSTLGVKTDNWVRAVGYQQLVEAASLGGGLLTSYTGLEKNHYGSTG